MVYWCHVRLLRVVAQRATSNPKKIGTNPKRKEAYIMATKKKAKKAVKKTTKKKATKKKK